MTPFLKARRAALDPVALGLPGDFNRRRVPGLRREEVAQLAGVSVDYYARIEQGRAPSVSDAIIDAIARALRLTEYEHAYLRNVTPPRHAPRATEAERPTVRPEALEFLAAVDGRVPAYVYGPGLDLLAWNRLAGLLTYDFDALEPAELNGARLMFLHPQARAFHRSWERHAADTVANLRGEAGRRPDRPRIRQVIDELLDCSADFRRCWATQSVQDKRHGQKVLTNPQVGELVMTYQSFNLPADPDQRISVYTTPPGSPTAAKLLALAGSAVA